MSSLSILFYRISPEQISMYKKNRLSSVAIWVLTQKRRFAYNVSRPCVPKSVVLLEDNEQLDSEYNGNVDSDVKSLVLMS